MRHITCNRCHSAIKGTDLALVRIIDLTRESDDPGRWRNLDLCPSCIPDLWDWIHAGPIAGDGASLTRPGSVDPVGSDPAAAASLVGRS